MCRFFGTAHDLGYLVIFCIITCIRCSQGTFLVKIIYIYGLIRVCLTLSNICALNHSIHLHPIFSAYFCSVTRTFYRISIHQKMQWLDKLNNVKFQ